MVKYTVSGKGLFTGMFSSYANEINSGYADGTI
jgi:hypothetical protein